MGGENEARELGDCGNGDADWKWSSQRSQKLGSRSCINFGTSGSPSEKLEIKTGLLLGRNGP